MKKLFIKLLAFVMFFIVPLAGCGSSSEDNGKPIEPSTPTTSVETPSSDSSIEVPDSSSIETVKKYTVTWVNYDDSVLEVDLNVKEGTMPSYDGNTPTREKDEKNTYSFIGWTPEVTEVVSDITYKATYRENVNSFTVTWKNYDGSILETDLNVDYGTMPTYDGEEPTRDGGAKFTYTFKGWTPEVKEVTENVTYTAVFTETLNKYTVTWVNYDGTVLETDENVEYGAIPTYDGENPTRDGGAKFTYTFKGWDKTVEEVTGDVTYKATFTEEVNKYTVTWVNYDGSVLETDKNVEYGTLPTYDGAVPTRDGGAKFTYTFKGWDKAIDVVTGDVTYTAQFNEKLNNYTVKWFNYDGSILEVDLNVDYGTMPTYDGIIPTRDGGAKFTYIFKGWSPVVEEVTGDVSYIAEFTETLNTYTVTWLNHDGSVLEIDENVGYGTIATYDGANPVKESIYNGANCTYYVFNGWNSSDYTVTGDVIYNAQFVEHYDEIIKYRIIDNVNNYVEILKGKDIAKTTALNIGETVLIEGKEYLVVAVSADAFRGCTNLESVILPNSITDIGANAFTGCTSLYSMTLPFIGENKTTNAFMGYLFGCTDYYNNKSFVPSSLKEVVVSSSIERYAFYELKYISNVVILDGATSIGDAAFCYCEGLRNITIPDSVTSIMNNAFTGCAKLSNIVLSNNITIIGNSAFSNCTSLKNIIIPVNVKIIGTNTFKNCTGLTSIVIPEGVETIENSAFSNCTSLNNIIIPSSVKTIEAYAFYNCTGLTSVTLNEGLNIIHDEAFKNCTKLIDITIPGSVTYFSGFDGCTGLVGVVIREGVTSIGTSALSGCTGLTSIDIPNTVKKIYDYAFCNCTGITNIVVPDSVELIKIGAFANCTSLKSITLPFTGESETSKYSHIGYIFGADYPSGNEKSLPAGLQEITITKKVGKNGFSNITNLPNIILMNGITSIGETAFANCTGLTSMVIPDSVTSYGLGIFQGCTSLKSITLPFIGDTDTDLRRLDYIFSVDQYGTIPTSLKEITVTKHIYDHAFNGCESLTNVVILDGVTEIGRSAFYNCTGLTSIVIPDSVTSIGSFAFEGCYNLKSMTLPFVGETSTTDTFIGYLFGGQSYQENKDVLPFKLEKIIISGGTTTIPENAFNGCQHLKSVEILNGVTTIGVDAFASCTVLTSIVISNSVTTIEAGAFAGCIGLTNILIPKSVTSIGNDSFMYCPGRTSIVVDKENPVYDSRNNCNAIIETKTNKLILGCDTTIIPEGVMAIGDYAFYACENLTNFVIPEGVTSIGISAFSSCTSLTTIEIPSSVTSIGNSSFSGCTSLTSVVIPNGVTTIERHTFSGCSNLRDVVIPSSVTSIGIYAFGSCTVLNNVVIPSSVISIGRYAFSDCKCLTSIEIPNSVKEMWEEVFSGCIRLESIYVEQGTNLSGWDYRWISNCPATVYYDRVFQRV